MRRVRRASRNDWPDLLSISAVYFVTDGVVSMVNEPEPGEIVEFRPRRDSGANEVRDRLEKRS